MTEPLQFFFVNKFGRLMSTFQKVLDDFCGTLNFYCIDERVPKKYFFLNSRETNDYDYFFQSHLIYISIINIMQNYIYVSDGTSPYPGPPGRTRRTSIGSE